MPIWCSSKIRRKAAFNDIHNKQKINNKSTSQVNKKSTTKAPRNSAKTYPKLPKTSERHDRHCCGIPVVKLGQVLHPVECF